MRMLYSIINTINDINNLNLLSTIMKSSTNKTTYSYSELAKLIGSDVNSIKSIYSLYNSKNTTTKLTPMEFVNFVINHRNDSALKGSINSSTFNELKLLQSIMNGVTNNTKYSSSNMSSLLGTNKSDVDLIYGLYMSKNTNANQTISLNTMVNFLVNDVMNNHEYSSNFDDNSKSRLKTAQSIIDASSNGTKYTKDEMKAIYSERCETLGQYLMENNTCAAIFIDSEEHRDPAIPYYTGHSGDAVLAVFSDGYSILVAWDEILAKKNGFYSKLIPYTRYKNDEIEAAKAKKAEKAAKAAAKAEAAK